MPTSKHSPLCSLPKGIPCAQRPLSAYGQTLFINFTSFIRTFKNLDDDVALELPWPSGYELRLSLERSRVLILVKVIGGRQEGHPVQKCSLLQQSPN